MKMTPQNLKELLDKAKQRLRDVSQMHDDALLAVARLRANADSLYRETGDTGYILVD
jgi:hypothetical protein